MKYFPFLSFYSQDKNSWNFQNRGFPNDATQATLENYYLHPGANLLTCNFLCYHLQIGQAGEGRGAEDGGGDKMANLYWLGWCQNFMINLVQDWNVISSKSIEISIESWDFSEKWILNTLEILSSRQQKQKLKTDHLKSWLSITFNVEK